MPPGQLPLALLFLSLFYLKTWDTTCGDYKKATTIDPGLPSTPCGRKPDETPHTQEIEDGFQWTHWKLNFRGISTWKIKKMFIPESLYICPKINQGSFAREPSEKLPVVSTQLQTSVCGLCSTKHSHFTGLTLL